MCCPIIIIIILNFCSPEKPLVYREEAWNALACPDCKGLIPSPVLLPIEDHLTSCDKCGKEFSLQSILQASDQCQGVCIILLSVLWLCVGIEYI